LRDTWGKSRREIRYAPTMEHSHSEPRRRCIYTRTWGSFLRPGYLVHLHPRDRRWRLRSRKARAERSNSPATMRCCACCSCAQRGPRQSGPVTDVTGRASWRGRASRRKVFLPGILSVVELWRYQKPCTAMADASYCRAEPKPCGDQAAAATGPGARTPSFAARSGHGL
jgi:hypothetical protein